ncbi:uncharacterized protein LOC135714177 [Ochlerotatus camptorhynchus]|uniref:uncharacterized protein LOC135714177 n=1 Tax=Ochlerotatus camptorhynchus TaxID=644619 RepID=UPI0031D55173
MKLKSVIVVLAFVSISHGRVLETKASKQTSKAPIVLQQDVEEYNDSENAVDGNISESNAVDESNASEIVNCYETNCNEASSGNADEETNSENNEVLQEINQVPQEPVSEKPVVNTDDANPINRYCKCTTYECNCCRDFALPLVPVKGPGCATVQYLEGNRMSIGVKFGDRVLASRVISGRKATPVCIPLPGGFNRFCGRIYGINRRADDHFKACLGLELRADNEIEAVLRVSCFKFGPRGLSVTEPEPLPPIADVDVDEDEDDDDDDDDDDEADDLLGTLGIADDDDDDDDDDDEEEGSELEEPEVQSSEPGDTGFSLLEGDFLGDFLGTTGQKKKKTGINKVGISQPATKNAAHLNPGKQSVAELADVIKPNITVTKTKNKDEDSSDEIADIVESIVTGGVEDSAENDDDDEEDDEDDDDDSKETKGVTEEPTNDEDDYDESEEENDVNNDEESSDTKETKKPKYGFNWSNFTRLFRIIS